MTTIRLFDYTRATGRLKELLLSTHPSKVKEGTDPNQPEGTNWAMAYNLDYLEANTRLQKAVTNPFGAVTEMMRQCMHIAVSGLNKCNH